MLTCQKTSDLRNYAKYLLLIFLIHAGLMIKQIDFTPDPVSQNSNPERIRVKLQDPLDAKRQIVRSEDSANKTRKDEAFLSDKDRSFDRQTKARKVDLFEKAAQGNANITYIAKSSSSKKSPTHNAKNVSLSKLGTAAGGANPLKKAAQEYALSKKGIKTGSAAGRSISSTNDYIEEIPLGDLTQLNTAEFKYYGFYHRIRQKLEQFWGRSIQEKAEDLIKEGRRVASDEDHITSLEVVMNSQGKIMDITVKSSSGIREFDDAAVESFNEAGPFPNPPRDLLVDGKVVIYFGFSVKS